MGMMDQLRKGFGYVLMCMGVSSPALRPKPSQQPSAPRPAEPSAGSAEKDK